MDAPFSLQSPVEPPSAAHRADAVARQAALTKPAGSLGVLEEVAVDMCGRQRTDQPRADVVPVIVFAGDHGVTARGVSPYPAEVTAQMMANFVAGGAAISVLARRLGSRLEIVDAGTVADPVPGVVVDRPCRGTADLSTGVAMSVEQVAHALGCGERAVDRTGPADLLVLGEMGIGNTTAATAIAAALLDLPVRDLVGRGAGLDDAALERKAQTIEEALALHGPAIAGADGPPLEALRRVGGLEIAALVGAIVRAARTGVPVLVDGFIVTVAAFVAVHLVPTCRPWLAFGTRSAEPGHDAVLGALDARPLLDLGLRLGEGSGAALAVDLVRAACDLHVSMATFAEASVSDRT